MMQFLKKLFKQKRKAQKWNYQEIIESIEQSREINIRARNNLKLFKAAIDGEESWFECSCSEIKIPKKMEANKIADNRPFDVFTPDNCNT